VDRLFGSETYEYTLATVVAYFPALPPAPTPKMGDIGLEAVRDEIPTPYAYSTQGLVAAHPAVSTQSQILFAVNPSLEMFTAYGAYCRTNANKSDAGATFQLSVVSSYSKLKIWSIEPYVDCPRGDDGSKGCFFGAVQGVGVPGSMDSINFKADNCPLRFSAMVTSLEYLDSNNIAVTVLNTTAEDFNFKTLTVLPDSKSTSYDIWYLDPHTMKFSQV